MHLLYFKAFLSSFQGVNSNPNISEIGIKMVFSATSLTHADKTVAEFETVSELLDKVYFERAERERVKSQAADLNDGLTTKLQN